MTQKQIEQAAIEYAESVWGDSWRHQAQRTCNQESFLAGAKSRQAEIDELIEALEELMKGVAGLPPLRAIEGALVKQFTQAEAAIRKAKGEEK